MEKMTQKQLDGIRKSGKFDNFTIDNITPYSAELTQTDYETNAGLAMTASAICKLCPFIKSICSGVPKDDVEKDENGDLKLGPLPHADVTVPHPDLSPERMNLLINAAPLALCYELLTSALRGMVAAEMEFNAN